MGCLKSENIKVEAIDGAVVPIRKLFVQSRAYQMLYVLPIATAPYHLRLRTLMAGPMKKQLQ